MGFIISSCTAQLKFGGSTGSSDNTNAGSKQPETDTRFFTGNQALDGGIVGLGAGLLGGAVLSGALSGGNNNGCGRRRRQAEGTNTKFLGALLGGSSSGCSCGRRRRQAPGEDKPGTRFFGLENLLGINNNNNCCPCGYNNNLVSCQCRYDLTFQDKYGNTIQYHTTSYNTIQHHITPYNIIQHHTTPYNTIQHHTTPYNTIQHHTYMHNHTHIPM